MLGEGEVSFVTATADATVAQERTAERMDGLIVMASWGKDV